MLGLDTDERLSGSNRRGSGSEGKLGGSASRLGLTECLTGLDAALGSVLSLTWRRSGVSETDKSACAAQQQVRLLGNLRPLNH